MELVAKLGILADAAKYDASCASSGSGRKAEKGGLGNAARTGICHSFTPDGRCISLLKVLLTNYCIYDCAYCVNRVSSETPRARFTPEEVVRLTIDFYRRNYIEGLFLSSGVIQNADYTMEQLIAVARMLRTEEHFHGYIHLKAVPGASRLLTEEAGRWADRLSANIELPLQADLDKLAPSKSHVEIETSMAQIQTGILDAKDRKGRRSGPVFAPAGQSTQLVVGATASNDSQILGTASRLYGRFGLRRVYYSAFSPIPHAHPGLPAAAPPLVREHRLYQADWLMRFYGFEAGELTTDAAPDLPLDRDPKLAWALRHREFFPVDVNRASKAALLRVPGFGVRNVSRIVQIRRYHALTLADLAKLRVPLNRARHFIVAAGETNAAAEIDSLKLPRKFAAARQLSLFEAPVAALTGEF